MATSVSVAQKLESAYVFIVPLAQAILRWHVKQMQSIYDKDSAIIDQVILHHGIIMETQIKLATLVGALELQVVFDRYQLGWMAIPLDSYFLEIVISMIHI